MSPVKRPSAVEGLRRGVGSPAPLGDESPSVSRDTVPAPVAVPVGMSRRRRREKPVTVRYTLDLDEQRHEFLKEYARGIEASGSQVLRALLDELRGDAALSARVEARVWPVTQ